MCITPEGTQVIPTGAGVVPLILWVVPTTWPVFPPLPQPQAVTINPSANNLNENCFIIVRLLFLYKSANILKIFVNLNTSTIYARYFNSYIKSLKKYFFMLLNQVN
jgi:hypothetical protein